VTTDPGRALITGEWQDVGRFKGPVLWGLNFYDVRFELNLTPQQKADLAEFLRAL
jgi:cytochrome c peroxidase